MKPRKERRRHRVFVTQNTEYHFRDDECVGVRDRTTGQWIWKHRALRGKVTGYLDRERRVWQVPARGFRLHLISRKGWILTSPIVEIRRPEKGDVWSYTSFVKSGEIVR